MAGQIKFYRKSHLDLDRDNPTITITDSVATNTGQAYANLLRNRNNNSGWLTTGSDDTANTEILVEFGDYVDIDAVMLVKHNFKDYLIEYYDGGSMSFVTYENVTSNTETTNIHTASSTINTNAIKITVYATQTADADKSMRQLIITECFGVGEFEGWPVIRSAQSSLNKQSNKLLGGRVNVIEKRGSFSTSLRVKFLTIDGDLSLIEQIFYNREGVLMLLSGGNEDQFKTKRIGYRNEDIVLVRPTNELDLPYDQGVYTNGIKIRMDLEEAIF